MRPDPARDYDRVRLERERTMAGLEERLRAIAEDLTDAEVLRLVHAMVDARARSILPSGSVQ